MARRRASSTLLTCCWALMMMLMTGTARCSGANLVDPEDHVRHKTFQFPASIIQHQYYPDSSAILVLLADRSIWQSLNDGYTWSQLSASGDFLAFYMHEYAHDRAYLIGAERVLYTTNSGKHWDEFRPPLRPNAFGIPYLKFHPLKEEYMLWTGMSDGCGAGIPLGSPCFTMAHYTINNGRSWIPIGDYVRNCDWIHDSALELDPKQILCEQFTVKGGDQRLYTSERPLELVSGTGLFEHQVKLFDAVVGFTKSSNRLVVAVMTKTGISLQVSLDGVAFALCRFPPNTRLEAHSFTILESFTESLFVYMSASDMPWLDWGTIMKSDAQGTQFTPTVDFVNREAHGSVDFEKAVGINGVGLINVVSNPEDAVVSHRKETQTKITHNDGGSWKSLKAPSYDSHGDPYECRGARCSLHLHGSAERYDPSATYSTPAVPGVLVAVGNVGEHLTSYGNSSTFYSRDAGVTWEEIHEQPLLWQFGDSGSILVAANDAELTNEVIFSTNEGILWWSYKFSHKKMRVRKIITSPQYMTRQFILLCENSIGLSVAVQLDLSFLTREQCTLNIDDSTIDDFEQWTPATVGQNAGCIAGRQMMYHRRQRTAECVVGDLILKDPETIDNCTCTPEDFECAFGYEREGGTCVKSILIAEHAPSQHEDSCIDGQEDWYERTAYRKIAHSSCEGGVRLDRGTRHQCGSTGVSAGHEVVFWWAVSTIPLMVIGMVMIAWWYRKHTSRRNGPIHLPDEEVAASFPL